MQSVNPNGTTVFGLMQMINIHHQRVDVRWHLTHLLVVGESECKRGPIESHLLA